MKILLLQEDMPPKALGGAGVVVAALAKEYERQGHEVAAVMAPRAYSPRFRAWRCLYNPTGAALVKRALADFKPDIVHAHNVHDGISYYSLILARKSGAKVVLTAHDVQTFNYGKLVDYNSYKVSAWRQLKEQRFRYNPFRNWFIRRILRTVSVVAVSQALKDALEANGITVAQVIHNGINASEWAENLGAAAFKQKYGLGEQVILFSGGSYLKGARQMLDAFALVQKQLPQAQLLVAGRSSMSGAGVIGAGWLSRDELRAAYHSALVVAVPSVCFDSFPTVNLEAMAAGKAVVATSLGGSREAVEDGKTGYIVGPFDAESVADKLSWLLADPAKAKEFGEAGKVRVQKEFSLQGQAQAYLELFHE